jgi:hypothetical protein
MASLLRHEWNIDAQLVKGPAGASLEKFPADLLVSEGEL